MWKLHILSWLNYRTLRNYFLVLYFNLTLEWLILHYLLLGCLNLLYKYVSRRLFIFKKVPVQIFCNFENSEFSCKFFCLSLVASSATAYISHVEFDYTLEPVSWVEGLNFYKLKRCFKLKYFSGQVHKCAYLIRIAFDLLDIRYSFSCLKFFSLKDFHFSLNTQLTHLRLVYFLNLILFVHHRVKLLSPRLRWFWHLSIILISQPLFNFFGQLF